MQRANEELILGGSQGTLQRTSLFLAPLRSQLEISENRVSAHCGLA
jgi:hypothetical protein